MERILLNGYRSFRRRRAARSFVETCERKFQEGSRVTSSNFNEDFAGIMVWFIEIENDAMFWRRVGEPARRKEDFEGFKCRPCDDDHP